MADVDTLVQSPDDATEVPAEGAVVEGASESTVSSGTEPVSESAAVDRGDGRDDKGRFAPKGVDADSSADPAKAEGSAPEADSTAPSTAKADPTDAATSAAPEADEIGPTEPLTWRAGNANWEFPGAVVTKHGIVIPPEHADLLKTALGKASSWDEDRAARNARNAQFRQEQELFKAETAPVMKEIEHVIGLFRTLSQAQTEQHQQQALAAVLEWGLGFVQREPDLRERMAFEKEKRSFELQKELAQPDPEQQQQALVQQIGQAVDQQIEAAKRLPEFASMTDADYADLKTLVLQTPQAFLVPNDDGVAFNGQQFALLARREARRTADVAKVKQEQQQAAEAAKRNAAKLASPTAPPPAGTAPKAPPAKPKQPDSPPPLQAKDEWLKEMGLLN